MHVKDEMTAIRKIVNILEPMDDATMDRVIGYVLNHIRPRLTELAKARAAEQAQA